MKPNDLTEDVMEIEMNVFDKFDQILLRYGGERAFFAAWFSGLVSEEDKHWFSNAADELGYAEYLDDLQDLNLATEYQDFVEVSQCLVFGKRLDDGLSANVVVGNQLDGIQQFTGTIAETFAELGVQLPPDHRDEFLEMITNYLTGNEAIQRFRVLEARFKDLPKLRSVVVKYALSVYMPLMQPELHSLSYRTFVGNRLLKLIWEHSHDGIPESQRWCRNFSAVQACWLGVDIDKLVEPLKSTDLNHAEVAFYVKTDSPTGHSKAITDLDPKRVEELANRKDWDRLSKLFRKYPILLEVVRSQGGASVDRDSLLNHVIETLKANQHLSIPVREIIWDAVRSHIELQTKDTIGFSQKSEWEKIIRRAVVRSEVEKMQNIEGNPPWVTNALDQILETGPSNVDELRNIVFADDLKNQPAFEDFQRYLTVDVVRALKDAEIETSFHYLLTA